MTMILMVLILFFSVSLSSQLTPKISYFQIILALLLKEIIAASSIKLNVNLDNFFTSAAEDSTASPSLSSYKSFVPASEDLS